MCFDVLVHQCALSERATRGRGSPDVDENRGSEGIGDGGVGGAGLRSQTERKTRYI